jgi:hypothetical protein
MGKPIPASLVAAALMLGGCALGSSQDRAVLRTDLTVNAAVIQHVVAVHSHVVAAKHRIAAADTAVVAIAEQVSRDTTQLVSAAPAKLKTDWRERHHIIDALLLAALMAGTLIYGSRKYRR